MNKIVMIAFYFASSLYAFSATIEPAPKVVLKEYKVGEVPDGFSYRSDYLDSPPCPSVIRTNESGDFFILDYPNAAIVRLSPKLEISSSITGSYYLGMALSNKYLVAYMNEPDSNFGDIYAIDTPNNLKVTSFEIKLGDPVDNIGAVYIDGEDFIFMDSRGEEIISYEMRGKELFRNAASEWSKYIRKGPDLFDKNRGIVKENAEDFFNYVRFKGYFDSIDRSEPSKLFSLRTAGIFAIDDGGMRYISEVDGDNPRIAVATKRGELVRVFLTHLGLGKEVFITRSPCVDKAGNIFYFESSPHGHNLVEIPRNW